MAPNVAPSGVLLHRLVDRFGELHVANFPGAQPPSKREISSWLDCDTHAVARWANASAHAGAHPEWRIPIRRVLELCHLLGASRDELDELMNARLQECQASGEKSDVLVLLRWLGPTFAELVERPVLDSQERQVLAAFNRVRAEVSGVSGTPGNLDHDRELEAGLSQWFHRALSTHFCEALAETSEVQTSSAAGQRRTKALASSNRRKAREVSVVPTQAEMRQMVRQFRDSLRKANAAEVSDA